MKNTWNEHQWRGKKLTLAFEWKSLLPLLSVLRYFKEYDLTPLSWNQIYDMPLASLNVFFNLVGIQNNPLVVRFVDGLYGEDTLFDYPLASWPNVHAIYIGKKASFHAVCFQRLQTACPRAHVFVEN